MLSPAPAAARKPEKAEEVVDLHYDKLSTITGEHSNAEKLKLQLDTFEKQLENAIAAGQHEVTFIHGTGSGVLREEIHRRLSKHDHVEYYKDARKEKFGYGATYVKIK